MSKIVAMIMGQNCENTIGMCLESVKDADAVVYCDGGSKDRTLDVFEGLQVHKRKSFLLQNEFKKEDPLAISKQRNFYLKYLKENYKDYWCIVLDADEVLDDMDKVKEWIKKFDGIGDTYLLSPRMRHLMNKLNVEDAVQPVHHVEHRFFKVTDDLFYPEGDHCILQSTKEMKTGPVNDFLIWHLGYLGGVWDIKKRYDGQMLRKEKNTHSEEFLNKWYKIHLLGDYPVQQFNPLELPEIILKHFGIEKDEFYHSRYQLELKHSIMVKQWYDYFKPESVLDLGCGRGCYLFFWDWFIKNDFPKEFNLKGIELSKWAVERPFFQHITRGDISKETFYKNNKEWDLITAIDVLEHLNNKQLDKTLQNMSKWGKKFLFSIPFEGDPNLLADSTHKQFHDRAWWIKKINSYGIELEPTPLDWLFHEQILIGKKKNE